MLQHGNSKKKIPPDTTTLCAPRAPRLLAAAASSLAAPPSALRATVRLCLAVALSRTCWPRCALRCQPHRVRGARVCRATLQAREMFEVIQERR